MAESYEIKGGWSGSLAEGQIYVARAVADSGRILATVRIGIPVDVSFDFSQAWGELGKAEIEKGAKEHLDLIAPKML